MRTLLEFGRLLTLCLSIALLGAASGRVASRVTVRPDLRIITAATVASFTAIVEALLLGLVGAGENGVALTLAALATFVVVWSRVPPAPGPSLLTQLVTGLRALNAVDGMALGGVVGGVLVSLAYLLRRPFTPYDALVYHFTEPVIWLHNQHPGSIVAINPQLPVQSFPKNYEVLLGWCLGLAHTWVVGTLLMFGFLALAALALIAALNLLGVSRRRAALAAVAILSIPVVVVQFSGPSNDIVAMAWLVVTAALCLGAGKEHGLLPMAFIAAGLALGTKATAGPSVVVILAIALFLARRRVRSMLVPLAVGGALGAGLAALWYVQNWVVYGAPLYPYYRFPAGPPVPRPIVDTGTSFLHSAGASLRAGTLHGYYVWSGGGVVFLIGLVVAAVSLPRRRGADRRWVGLAILAAVVSLLIWSTGPFTGYPDHPGTSFFPLDGVRYMIPVIPVIGLPTLLLLRNSRRLGRRLVELALVAAVAANVWALRSWPPPYRPPVAYVVAGLAVGAAIGAWGPAVRHWPVGRPRWLRLPAITAGAIIVAAGGLTLPATGYLTRAVAIAQPAATTPYQIPAVVGWLNRQPDWVHGHQPVGTGPILDAYLSGPTFAHPLVLVRQSNSCPLVRRMHDTDWLVLRAPEHVAKGFGIRPFTRATCLAGVPPSFATSVWRIYRPTR